ncbi:MAG: GerMN domain-containing protein [Caldisericia bacterium]|nr:GerMN domain-containing protein [Caldisericia bacterium]
MTVVKKKKKHGKKKNKLGRVLFRLILLLGLLALIIFLAVKAFSWLSGVVTGNQEPVTVYYYDDIIGTLVPFEHKVDASDGLPQAIVREICAGPAATDHAVRTVAKGTKLLSLEIVDKTAVVNLSGEAQTPVPPCPEDMSLLSITNSLCGVDGIESVRYQIDAVTPAIYWIETALNQEFRKQDLKIPAVEHFSVYFPEKRDRYVAREEVTVKKTDLVKDKARLVLQRFIQGPKLQALKGPLSKETKILGLTFAGSKLTINLSSAGLNLNTDAKGELLFAQSIVWTLTDIKNVRIVQFLVDGKPASSIGGHISFSDEFTRLDQRLIENPEESVGSTSIINLAADLGDGIYVIVPRIRFLTGPAFEREPLDKLFAGPSPTEKELEIISCIPIDTELKDIKFSDGQINVYLSAEATKTPNKAIEEAFIEQIVRTATETDENRLSRVTFFIDGEARESLPNGTPISKRARQVQ